MRPGVFVLYPSHARFDGNNRFRMISSTVPDDSEPLDDLLRRVAHRDERAFADVYRRTSPRLFGLCLRVLGDRDDAEEALQECFVIVWKRASSFDPRLSAASTWLVAVARNKAIDRLRLRPRAHGAVEPDWDAIPGSAPDPADAAGDHEAYRRLRACLDELDHRQRHCVRDAFFGGFTYAELADRVKVPLGTVKGWIRRALRQLRACMTA